MNHNRILFKCLLRHISETLPRSNISWTRLHRTISSASKWLSSFPLNNKQTNVETVLPIPEEVGNKDLTQRIDELDKLISDINKRIAEQHEIMFKEDKEIEELYGVSLPAEYKVKIGSVDPDCPPSRNPCTGCGAPIHCCAPEVPGFVPSTTFKTMSRVEKMNCKCIRCQTLEEHGVALDVKVSEGEFNDLMGVVRKSQSIILHVVDMADMNNSLIPDLPERVGRKHPIYIIGNKIDLLPPDSKSYMRHITTQLTKHAVELYGPERVRHVCLVSALTGYGIEELINKLFKHSITYKASLNLVGCTNSGKSTLFNRLLMSDLCNSRARDHINRATTSIWPGTTINLLKFPLYHPPAWLLKLRVSRLMAQRRELSLAEEEAPPTRFKVPRAIVDITQSEEEVTRELEQRHESHFTFNTFTGSIMSTKEDSPVEGGGDFNYKNMTNTRWLFDTPGLINPKQMINQLPMADLQALLIKSMPRPKTHRVKADVTMFLSGAGRIDITKIEGSEPHTALLTVITASGLPVKTMKTDEADEFYSSAMQDGRLLVPSPESAVSLEPLQASDVVVEGSGPNICAADVQLSSLGWVAVSAPENCHVHMKVWTPGARGIVKRPCLLPHCCSSRAKGHLRLRKLKDEVTEPQVN